MSDRIAATVFYILSVLLFPVRLIGYVIWVGKGLFTGHASGVSGTAQGPLSARFFEHHLGTRQDEPANRLMMVLPGVPPLGVRLVAHRVTGYVPSNFGGPIAAALVSGGGSNATSDLDGFYALQPPAYGQVYALTASASGYNSPPFIDLHTGVYEILGHRPDRFSPGPPLRRRPRGAG